MNNQTKLEEISLVIIAAVAKNGVIGNNNKLPWPHIKEDMKHFRKNTLGKPIIMGRKTFESLGVPLPKRHNIVITRDTTWHSDAVEVAHSLEDAIAMAKIAAQKMDGKEIYCIGGAEIYKLFLPLANRLEITRIDLKPEGDAFFPDIDNDMWEQTNEASIQNNVDNGINFSFIFYNRR